MTHPDRKLSITILGLSITSSWGNGHATTYRGLVRELAERGHGVTFLERDVPWYAARRDLPRPRWCRTHLYADLTELRERHRAAVVEADVVIVGSYVPDGVEVAEWVLDVARGVTAFYDIDTPVTLAKLSAGDHEYLTPELVPAFDLYLSFAGGTVLDRLEELGARRARPLFCSVDTSVYRPQERPLAWQLGYMGTYSDDRQPGLERLLLEPARTVEGEFLVVGPGYPREIEWPVNVHRIEHLPPAGHRAFYTSQRFTLNLTRQAMVEAGWSPSVRLFEAAACGTPIVSDPWPGLERFFVPGEEIFTAESADEVREILETTSEEERRAVAERARAKVLAEHTAACRAAELETYALELLGEELLAATG